MTRAIVAGGALATGFALLALTAVYRTGEQDVAAAATSTAMTTSVATAHEGLLYGRITTDDGEVYEGRLRFGGDEEALWGNYFNGFKDVNPWVAYATPEGLPKERFSIGVFGIEFAGWDRPLDLGRPFMARMGDIARIEARGRELRVTLKSGTVFDLDRYSADDFADGLRVWDERRGVVDLGEWGVRTIELLPAAPSGAAPTPLYGTVRTRQGDFAGLIQWDREAAVGSDELHGQTPDGEISLRFDAIRSIARQSGDGSLVTLLDGSEIVLSGSHEVGDGNRGIYVDDQRYGRVLVSWDAFESVDFSPGGNGPAYEDFPPGSVLTGRVITRSGRRLAGQLVFDLDESESTETLDAPSEGVDYTLLFSLVASIVPPGLEEPATQRTRVTLHSGEELQLESTGDLGEGNAGLLIFVDGGQRPEYVPWTEVEQIDFDRPPVIYRSSDPQ